MKNPMLALLAAASLAATASVFAATDPAMDQMLACMKLRAASPEQKACIAKVRQMRVPAPAAKPAMAPKMKSTVLPSSATTAPTVIAVPSDVKLAAAAVGLNGGQPSLPLAGGITVGDLKGLDLESAMMAVQSRRANLLEAQLKNQIDGVEARNNQIASANDAITALRAVRPAGDANQKVSVTPAQISNINGLYAKAGIVPAIAGKTQFDASFTQAQVDASVDVIKSAIDSLNNSQQMDMLRLQSLTNKRNEAFDLMTNFIKKMSDSRSSILGNMR